MYLHMCYKPHTLECTHASSRFHQDFHWRGNISMCIVLKGLEHTSVDFDNILDIIIVLGILWRELRLGAADPYT